MWQFCQVKRMEVEIVGWGKANLFFSYFSVLSWKMDLIIGAPAAILGLGKKAHKNCIALAMLFLGLNHCQEPPSSRLLLHEDRLLCWSHCSRVSVTISQTQFLLFSPPVMMPSFMQWPKAEIQEPILFLSSIPDSIIPCTHPLTMYSLLYLVISLVAASSCLVLLPCHHSDTQLHLLGLLKCAFTWSLAFIFTVLLSECTLFQLFSDASWPTAVPFKHFKTMIPFFKLNS